MNEFGVPATHSFSVKNSGSVSFDITDFSFEASSGSGFSIDSTTCSAATLAPNDACSVVIQFAPTERGYDNGALLIETSLGTWRGIDEVGANWVAGTGSSRLNVELAGDGKGGVTSDGGGNPNVTCGPGVGVGPWPRVGTDCSGLFADDQPKYLTAYPVEPDTFAGWSLESCGTDPVCEVALSIYEATTVTATFAHVDVDPCNFDPCLCTWDPCICASDCQ